MWLPVLELYIFARLFWRARKTLVKQPPGLWHVNKSSNLLEIKSDKNLTDRCVENYPPVLDLDPFSISLSASLSLVNCEILTSVSTISSKSIFYLNVLRTYSSKELRFLKSAPYLTKIWLINVWKIIHLCLTWLGHRWVPVVTSHNLCRGDY